MGWNHKLDKAGYKTLISGQGMWGKGGGILGVILFASMLGTWKIWSQHLKYEAK